MASVVDICNKALSLLGQAIIVSLTDDSPSARACAIHWPALRDETLRGHPWNCVTKRWTLNRLNETPEFEFEYAFQLPADCLMVLATEPACFYEVEGRKILCDESSLAIKGIERNDDTSQYDPQLASALAFLLAAELCPQMTSSSTEAGRLYGLGTDKLKEAKASDAIESRRRQTHGNRYVNAKIGGIRR